MLRTDKGVFCNGADLRVTVGGEVLEVTVGHDAVATLDVAAIRFAPSEPLALNVTNGNNWCDAAVDAEVAFRRLASGAEEVACDAARLAPRPHWWWSYWAPPPTATMCGFDRDYAVDVERVNVQVDRAGGGWWCGAAHLRVAVAGAATDVRVRPGTWAAVAVDAAFEAGEPVDVVVTNLNPRCGLTVAAVASVRRQVAPTRAPTPVAACTDDDAAAAVLSGGQAAACADAVAGVGGTCATDAQVPAQLIAAGVATAEQLNALFAACPATCGACDDAEATVAPPAKRTYAVEVDLGRPERVNSMSGFIGTIGDAVPQALVAPLDPKLWRWTYTGAEERRVRRLGARPVVVVSDGWGYPTDNGKGVAGAPWEDYAAWEAHVRAVAAQHGSRVIYDIWNEPDQPMFWGAWEGATWQRFLETFKRAHDVIRAVAPRAWVSGPATSYHSPLRLALFMDYAREAGLRVDVLSLHLLFQADEVALGVIDEPGAQSYRAGSVLAFLRRLETAGVDAAARACWAHADVCPAGLQCYLAPSTTCRDGTIDGLLTPALEPRAVWWAYKHYADGVRARVRAGCADSRMEVLASKRGDGAAAQVLLAHNGAAAADSGVRVALYNVGAVAGLRRAAAVRVEVRRIPSDGDNAAPVAALETIFDGEVPVADGRAVLALDGGIRPYEAYVVLLHRTA